MKQDVVDWRDVPASEYNAKDIRTRFTGAHDYARRNGYQHGYPNFHEANYGKGVVYGTFLIKPGTCEWRDVPAKELGLGTGDPSKIPMENWFRGASDYASKHNYAAAMPNGHYANYGLGYVCGVFLFPKGKAEWRDIRGRELGLPEPIPRVPDPKTKTTVPNIVGLLSSQASQAIMAAKLRTGYVLNGTGEIRSDLLRVKGQDPTAGTSVDEGTSVNYSVELAQQQQGVKSVLLVNRHQQGRSVEVFLWDSAVGNWSNKGMLNFGASTTLSLASGRLYQVVAVDRGLINCTDGRPENVSCQRFSWGARGDSGGVQVTLNVP
ncbi:PASTA domain-containing protein [Neobacillus sp. GCM10023253]